MKKLLCIFLFAPLALFGQDNYSMSFDGVDDGILVNHSESFEYMESLTISFDVMIYEFPSNYYSGFGFSSLAGYRIIEKWSGEGASRSFEVDFVNEGVLQSGDATPSHVSACINGGCYNAMDLSLIELNKFNNVSLVFDGDSIYSYLNGNHIKSIDIPDFDYITYQEVPMSIGNSTSLGFNSNKNQFDGKLDNVQIWRKALSENEVKSIISCPLTGQEEGLVGYWNFNEGDTNTVEDKSSNGNHGIIHGATYSEDVPEESCVIEGCTDSLMYNFNDEANTDDGSCEPYSYGCTDSTAYNFDEVSNTDDGTCVYAGNQNNLWYVSTEGSDTNSGTINSPFSSIQEAIDASDSGDEIQVAAGTYYVNNLIINKDITIIGESRDLTIIDGSGSNRIMTIESPGQDTLLISNFTIQNGHALNNLGGVIVFPNGNDYSISVFDNLIIQNSGGGTGNVLFEGAGVNKTTYQNCIIRNNSAENYAGIGGATVIGTALYGNSGWNNTSTLVGCNTYNCVVYNNGGGYGAVTGGNTINSIIWNNQSSAFWHPESVTFSNIEGGYEGEGNINSDPLFTDASNDNFTLLAGSPCIDSGDPDSSFDPDGTRADIGAFYFHQTFGCTDSLMYNFNDEANTDDGSCEPYTYGCMDSTAINYEESINLDDESCEYDLTANAFSGCNDPDADNYNTNATSNDSSCFYNHQLIESFDMTFDSYFYYESNVLEEEESYKVIVSGSYGVAWNNGKDAAYYYQCCDWPDDEILVSNSIWSEGISYRPITNHYKEHHEYIYSFSDFNEPIVFEFIDNGGYGDNFGSLQIEIWKENLDKEQDSLLGCTDSLMYNFNDEANTDDGSCEPYSYGCADSTAYNFDEVANTDDGSCISIEEFTIDSLQEALSVFETVSEEEDYSILGLHSTVPRFIINDEPEFTIQVSAKTNNIEASYNIYRQISGGEIGFNFHSGLVNLSLKASYGNCYTASGWTGVSDSIPDTDWHTYTATYDRNLGVVKLYIDTNLVDSLSINDGSLANCSTYTSDIGSTDSDVYVDELVIYNHAQSISQIQSGLLECDKENNLGRLAHWDFNEGSGDTVYDISGNGNHGIIHGATYSEDVPDTQKGCTDVKALNYDETALCDNGSCVYSSDEYILLEEENLVLSDSLSTSQQNLTLLEGDASTSLSSMQLALDSWNTTVDLADGWNMFGYGCPEAIDLVQAMSDHTDNIIIIKDNSGKAYMPQYNFNGIGDLSPGLGYQIKVTEAIEGFSLCDWYVNDIPDYNIVSLQEENASMKAELDSLYGCMDEGSCNFDSTAVLNDNSCDYETCLDECGVINGDNTTCLDCAGVPNGTAEDLGCGCGNPAAQEGYDCEGNEITSYQVGDLAHGGIVFYVDETGKHGLVAASGDLPGTYEWGCFEENVNGADGTSIGTGYQNTLDIVNQECSTVNGGITAAQAALDAEINGYSDWYIPSKDELVEMYNTIGNGGSEGNIGGFSSSWYWSSSGRFGLYIHKNNAWNLYFGTGFMASYYTDNDLGRVRVIRSF